LVIFGWQNETWQRLLCHTPKSMLLSSLWLFIKITGITVLVAILFRSYAWIVDEFCYRLVKWRTGGKPSTPQFELGQEEQEEDYNPVEYRYHPLIDTSDDTSDSDDIALLRYTLWSDHNMESDTKIQHTLPPLVFVMDAPNVLENFVARVFEPLEDDGSGPAATPAACTLVQREIIAYEPRGCGFSQPSNGYDFTVQSAARDCVSLLKSLQAEFTFPSFILAFSCGNVYISQYVAQHHPDFVSGIVACQAPDVQEEIKWMNRLDPMHMLRLPFLGQMLNFLARRKLAKKWMSIAVSDQELQTEMSDRICDALDQGACFCLASLLQMYADSLTSNTLSAAAADSSAAYHNGPDTLNFIAKIPADVPTMAVWGDKDRSHRKTIKDSSSNLHADPATVEIVHIEHAAHFPELEQPHQFFALMQRFCQAI
jgi:pimeloyl-ACP methyl ester carboxylesterase